MLFFTRVVEPADAVPQRDDGRDRQRRDPQQAQEPPVPLHQQRVAKQPDHGHQRHGARHLEVGVEVAEHPDRVPPEDGEGEHAEDDHAGGEHGGVADGLPQGPAGEVDEGDRQDAAGPSA